MIALLLFVIAMSPMTIARRRKQETTTWHIIEGPLHAITSNPTTSFETYSATITSSKPITEPPTTSHRSLETRTPPYITEEEQPVTNKVFVPQNLDGPLPEPNRWATNFTYVYSSMSPLPSPTSTQPLPSPNTTLSHLPNTTHLPTNHVTTRPDKLTTHHVTTEDHVTTEEDHVTSKEDDVTTKPGYNFTEEGTEGNNNTVVECEECALARPLGYLISCLVVVGVVINLLCYVQFLRRVNGVTGKRSQHHMTSCLKLQYT